MSENENNQKNELDDFTAKALRRNQTGSYEEMLAQHLIKAVAAHPTSKIRLICEAALMLPKLPAEDQEKLNKIYPVALSFEETRINVKLDANNIQQVDWHGIIAWSFPRTKETYEEYIQPWVTSLDGLYYKPRTESRMKTPEEREQMTAAEYFFWVTCTAHNSTLEILKARFSRHYMPYIMQINRMVCRHINPDTYNQMLGKVRQ